MPWDTIGIVSPSWWVPSIFPNVYIKWIHALKKIWFHIKEMETAKALMQTLKENPIWRAEDINRAFEDNEVDGIVTSIWWGDSIRILQYLDIERIKRNHKLFLWFSDTTVIHTYLNQKWLVTFNGPSVMAWFAQLDYFSEEYTKYLQDFLFNRNTLNKYPSWDNYCNGYKENEEWRPNIFKDDITGPKLLQWEWIVQWKILGWCLEALEYMKSTDSWPEDGFWKWKILFLEKALRETDIEKLKSILRYYGEIWVFNKISALLFWRFKDHSEEEKKDIDVAIKDIISGEFNERELPIVTNMSFGHTDPQFILPLWINAKFDCDSLSLRLLESPFQ